MDESLIKKTAGLSLDDEPVIVEYPTPRTVSTTKKVKSAKTKKEKTKRKKEKKEREVEVEETEYKDPNSKVLLLIQPLLVRF